MQKNKTANRVKSENLFRRENEYFAEDDEYRDALEMRTIAIHRKAAGKSAKGGVSCRICRA